MHNNYRLINLYNYFFFLLLGIILYALHKIEQEQEVFIVLLDTRKFGLCVAKKQNTYICRYRNIQERSPDHREKTQTQMV